MCLTSTCAAGLRASTAAMIAAKLADLDITGPAPPTLSAGPPSGLVDLVLAVTADQVRLTGGGTESVPENAHSQEQTGGTAPRERGRLD